jgi:hypothetical protein
MTQRGRPSLDPRRFKNDPESLERRFELAFTRLRGVLDQANTLGSRADAAEMTLEARPNSTTGTGDKVLTLAGSRGIRGKRAQVVEDEADAFTVWTTGVSFASAYPAAPVVTVTPLSSSAAGISAVLTDVNASGFTVRLTASTAQTRMDFQFQVWGDT